MSWILFATTSSVFWGITYAIYGHLLKTLTIPVVLFISSVSSAIFFLIVSLYKDGLSEATEIVFANKTTQLHLVAMIVAIILGNILVSMAMVSKN